MRLTRFTDIGLRACMRLASDTTRVFSTHDLASELRISRHHLMKIMGALAAERIVVTRRGTGGGAQLARAPNAITVGRIVNILEKGTALVECFEADGGQCTITPKCRLKGMLAGAERQFIESLDRFTLADCITDQPFGASHVEHS